MASVLEKAKAIPGITKAAPFLQTQGGATRVHGNSTGVKKGVAIVGILPEGTPGADVTSIRSKALFGDFKFQAPDSTQRLGVVLGSILAANLGAYPGDTLQLYAQSDDLDPITGEIKISNMRVYVTGTFETGLYEYDATYLYMDLALAQRFAGFGNDVTGVELAVKDRWKSRVLADVLDSALSAKTPTAPRTDSSGASSVPVASEARPELVRLMDWQEQNKPLFQALKLEKLGMAVILLLIVVIAAFNIVSTLTMVVADKTREIGILQAMGLPAKSIRKVFVYQGMIIGAIGTLSGLVLGLLVVVVMIQLKWPRLDPQIYFIDHVPVIVLPQHVVLVAWPAWQSQR